MMPHTESPTPRTQTATPTSLGFNLPTRVLEDSPALYASRKVVVVVEMRTMSSAPTPSPMLLMPTAMLSCPREASPMPSIYIQTLPIV